MGIYKFPLYLTGSDSRYPGPAKVIRLPKIFDKHTTTLTSMDERRKPNCPGGATCAWSGVTIHGHFGSQDREWDGGT